MLTLAWVQRYIKLGFIVHPCCPADHGCSSPGKIPYNPYKGIHMENWQNHEQFHIANWESWLDKEPNINIGVLTGSPSGLLFIDIDSEGAENEFRRLQQKDTIARGNSKVHGRAKSEEGNSSSGNYWAFATGRGRRYIFRATNGPHRSSKRITPCGDYIEILGDGRQSVLPPSLHGSGKRYRWLAQYTPRSADCDNAPAWCGRGNQSEAEGTKTPDKPDWTREVTTPTRTGSRNETLTRLAGHLISPQPLPVNEVRLWLNAYNKTYCNPPLEQQELDVIISSIWRREEAQESKVRAVMKELHCNREAAENYLIESPEIFEKY